MKTATSLAQNKRKSTLTRLAVGENARIVALERIVENVTADAIEHLFLAGKVRRRRVDGEEAMVERKRLRLFAACEREGEGTNSYSGVVLSWLRI